ncbi:17462_t:CDS:1, partial [Dentiscutata heterogama]
FGDESEKLSQQMLRTSMDRLLMKSLQMLCKSESLSKAGTKKKLIEKLAERIVSKAKEKNRVKKGSQVRKA